VGAWERLLEAVRGDGKLSLLLLESSSSSTDVSFWIGEGDGI